jgi:hypothetical protein
MKLTKKQKALVKKYGHLFCNTGGNDIVELAEREGVTYFNNAIVAELQGCCHSQILLLERMVAEGLLPAVEK